MKEVNLSLVAFYGDKPPELADLIIQLQAHLANHPLLEKKFVPYQMEQVHGTIIGCEGWKTDSGIISRWFQANRSLTRQIDLAGLLDHLQQHLDLPIAIRFGGYDRQIDYSFLSRNQHLCDRSFQLQPGADQTIPVVIGWSWQDNAVTQEINQLRLSFQQFGLLHKYHANLDSIDNDFYLRLGTINTQLSALEVKTIAGDMTELLATAARYIPINLTNLCMVRYQDLQLTPTTTTVIAVESMTLPRLEQLYL